MIFYHNPQFDIAFGNKDHSFKTDQFKMLLNNKALMSQNQFKNAIKLLNIDALIVAEQTHGTDGIIIDTYQKSVNCRPYNQQADFIITNIPKVGIGIATADCLPIIIYDSSRHVIAAIHAGW